MGAAISESDNTLALELGRELTRAIAPEELEFFDELAFAGQKPASKGKDRVLGFGVHELATGAVSAAMFSIAKDALAFLWLNAKDETGALIKDLSAEAHKRVASAFKKRLSTHDTSGVVSLSAEDAGKLEVLIRERAAPLGMSDADRDRLVAAVKSLISARPLTQ